MHLVESIFWDALHKQMDGSTEKIKPELWKESQTYTLIDNTERKANYSVIINRLFNLEKPETNLDFYFLLS